MQIRNWLREIVYQVESICHRFGVAVPAADVAADDRVDVLNLILNANNHSITPDLLYYIVLVLSIIFPLIVQGKFRKHPKIW